MGWLRLAVECITKNYVNFDGRANRAEYWGFELLMFLVMFALSTTIGIVAGLLGASNTGLLVLSYVVIGLFSVAMLCPAIAVGVRRLHDIGKGGGWIFISFIPIIGGIWFLVLTLLHGERSENRFGQIPATTIR